MDPSAPLPDLTPGAVEDSTKLRAVEESGSRLLGSSLTVDIATPGTYETPGQLPEPRPAITAGTLVDTYLIHSDPVGETPAGQKRITVTLTFPSDVHGIIVTNGLLDASDDDVGSRATVYPAGNEHRGLELAPKVDFIEFRDRRTVSVSVLTTTVVDQVRILTAAVPAERSGGYRLVAEDGGVFSFGSADFRGSTGSIRLNKPMVGGSRTCSSNGYWLVASDGGIFAFGDARFFGSTGNIKLNRPVVGMAPTPSGNGYWLVASDGGIFAFGDAGFFGSTGNIELNRPVVGMAPTLFGEGYWLTASDGGIFSFGDARFFGSTGNIRLNQPMVSML